MEPRSIEAMLAAGESTTVEFKRCGSQPGTDVFETICAFANRDGGSVLLGVSDSGEAVGVAPGSELAIERNIVNVTHNPRLFSPAPVVEFERADVGGRRVVRVWVPSVQGVFRFKGEVYDRVADADVRVRGEAQVAALHIRKYGIYTEQHIFPHLELSDLRPDLIERARSMAAVRRPGHPWATMCDEDLLRSAQLWGKDIETGQTGYNRACALLLGRDEVIPAACPAYKTDAYVKLRDEDRYDDREVVRTNLLDAFEGLCSFLRRHLPDPFALDGDARVSVRDVVVRELVSNTLIHREYTSPYPARAVIDGDGLVTENASRALFDGRVSLSGFSPTPKNPIIAGFFAQVGYAEELGSGVRNLQRYSRLLMGADPVLEEGDVFVARIPDARGSLPPLPEVDVPKRETLAAVATLLAGGAPVSVSAAASAAGVTPRTATKYLRALVDAGYATAEGVGRSRTYALARR